MKRQQRAAIIQNLLEFYFPKTPIPLKHKDPYTLLIAVLLSAQCTDIQVNKVTPKLFELASTPEEMAACDTKKIEEIIRPCGLAPTKSKAIKRLSQDLITLFNSSVPKSLDSLETLPGVGHKTASVVISQAFKIPAFPVDTHIHRCAKRWNLSRAKNVMETEKDLKNLFPKELWNKLHLQIIYYARHYCPARSHQIAHCPICHILQ